MDKAQIESVIRAAQFCRLGMVDDGQPYVVAVCFGYRDNVLYFHGKQRGRKMEALRKNNRVCVEFDVDAEPVRRELACKWSFKYRSVIGFGRATVLEDAEEKRRGLDLIMRQFEDRDWTFPDESLARTAVVRVEFDELTGKSAGY